MTLETKESRDKSPESDGVDWAKLEGSLEADQALETYKIADDDERWISLDSSGSTKKLILRKGSEDVTPTQGDIIWLKYSVFNRATGETLEDSRDQDPVKEIEWGTDILIEGWMIGLATMKLGEYAILRCKPEVAYGEDGVDARIPKNATLDCVIEMNDIPLYLSIGDDDNIKKKTIREKGTDMWKLAKEYSTVIVSYVGREVDWDGRKWCEGKDQEMRIAFDLEFEGKGTLEEYDHPRGFYVCLQNLNRFETAHFKITSCDAFTFGSTGSEKFGIPPNTDLWYEITISKIDFFVIGEWDLDVDLRLPRALELKDIANDFFKKKKLQLASHLWDVVIAMVSDLHDDKDDESVKDELKSTCYSNRALVELQLRQYDNCEEIIRKGLALNPKHEKLRYREIFLNYKRGNYNENKRAIAKFIEDFPENKPIRSLAIKNSKAEKLFCKENKNLAMKMFPSNMNCKYDAIEVEHIYRWLERNVKLETHHIDRFRSNQMTTQGFIHLSYLAMHNFSDFRDLLTLPKFQFPIGIVLHLAHFLMREFFVDDPYRLHMMEQESLEIDEENLDTCLE